MPTIKIAGLNQAEVLAALRNHAKPARGFSGLQEMSVKQAQDLLASGHTFFGIVDGRDVRVLFLKDEVDVTGYNRINGAKAAESIIQQFVTRPQEALPPAPAETPQAAMPAEPTAAVSANPDPASIPTMPTASTVVKPERTADEVAKLLAGIYCADLATESSGIQPEFRDVFWRQSASSNPQFSEKILALRQALKEARDLRRENKPGMNRQIDQCLGQVKDDVSQRLLADLLTRKVCKTPERMGPAGLERVRSEMFRELGIPENEGQIVIFPERIISRVLAGKAKI